MSTVVMHNVVSVDGYIAEDNDDVGPLFEWYFNGDHPLTPGEMDEPSPGGLRVSKASYDYIRPTWDARVDGDRAPPVRHDQRLGGPAADGRARGRGIAPAQAGRVAPGGVVPFRRRRGSGDRDGEGVRGRAHRCGGGGRRRWAGPRAGPGGRGGDGRRTRGVRLRQAILRAGRRPALAGGPRRGHPGRPGAARALPGSSLRSHGRHASAASRGLQLEVQRLVFGVLAQKGVCLALEAGDTVRDLGQAAGYVLNGVSVVPRPGDWVFFLAAHSLRIRWWVYVPTTSENASSTRLG